MGSEEIPDAELIRRALEDPRGDDVLQSFIHDPG
jgi:hypothetical protein